MKKFPKTLCVKQDKDGDSTYFVPYENVLDAAELGIKVKIGVYKLVGTQEIEGVVETRKMQMSGTR